MRRGPSFHWLADCIDTTDIDIDIDIDIEQAPCNNSLYSSQLLSRQLDP